MSLDLQGRSATIGAIDPRRATDDMRPIPKIIHQVWLGGTDGLPAPPERMAEASRTWAAANPGWDHRLWTGAELDALFARLRPDLLELYRGYRYFVQRADAARYLVLHEYGGVYADFDIACLRPLDSLDGLDTAELVLAPTRPFGVSNDLMMARPGHPLFLEVLDGLPAAHRQWNRWWVPQYLQVMAGTASLHLSRVCSGRQETDAVRLLTPAEYGHQGPEAPLVRHLEGNTWHSRGSRALLLAWSLRKPLLVLGLALAAVTWAALR